ncbi:hypothetical protein VNO77_02406 [Canavalia gladiata]|uniref:Uncharacterized protein n=1 Tax=Canavalia gladiata TaxID=3824 RepID=A0AAN9MZF9_CANGL
MRELNMRPGNRVWYIIHYAAPLIHAWVSESVLLFPGRFSMFSPNCPPLYYERWNLILIRAVLGQLPKRESKRNYANLRQCGGFAELYLYFQIPYHPIYLLISGQINGRFLAHT